MKLASKIEKLLLEKEICPSNLATQLNIQPSTISRMLNGSTISPHLNTIFAIADFFGVSVNYLLDDQENDYFKTNSRPMTMKDIMTKLLIESKIFKLTLLHRYTSIPKSVLSDIMNDKTRKPQIKTLKKIASFFGLTLAQILGKEPIQDFQWNAVKQISKSVPVINIKDLNNWYNGKLRGVNIYTSKEHQKLGPNSLIITFTGTSGGNDFQKDEKIIINGNKLNVSDGDYIVAKISKDQYYLCQYKESEEHKMVRPVGRSSYIKISPETFRVKGIVSGKLQ